MEKKHHPSNTPEKNDKTPIDDWTFWTLVAGFVIYSGLLAFAVVWAIIH